MIKSIQFTGGKEDYIDYINYKDVPRKGVSQKKFEEVGMKTHHRGLEYEKVAMTVNDGYRNPLLQETIKGRKFTFAADKVNILFGPNASGKSTIIKTLAEHCLCGSSDQTNDGFTSLTKYTPGFRFVLKDDDDCDYDGELRERIEHASGNAAEVIWDGADVFNENHDGHKMSNVFGNMIGGIISDGKEEMLWHIGKSTTSAGQKTIYIANKLVSIASHFKTPEEIIEANEEAKEKARHNNLWLQTYKAQLRYYNEMIKKAGGLPDNLVPTIMLDEMDKSLDLLNVITLYSEFMPNLMKKMKCQIIAVSHSPIILCDGIYNSDDYNIISMDDNYTEQCLKNLSKII